MSSQKCPLVDNIVYDKNIEQSKTNIGKYDERCSPTKIFQDGSCYDVHILNEMAKAYNKYNKKKNNDDYIELCDSYIVSKPKIYKKYLLYQFNKRFMDVCTNQRCWGDQEFMQELSKEIENEIKYYTFRPSGPQGKFDWLSTININDVFRQYEKKYKDFIFLGAVPIDFDNLAQLGIRNLDIEKLLNEGKYKIGIVFNLDEHWKSGSHWVSLFIDIDKKQIYFFDSYGIEPEKRIINFMNRMLEFMKKKYNVSEKEIDMQWNKNRHQYKNSECGVYSINFQLQMLKGTNFDQICKKKLLDDQVNECRSVYFIPDN